MAENDGNDRGPVSRGGIAPQPLFAVGAVLLGSFLANFDSRLTSVGLPDLRSGCSVEILGFGVQTDASGDSKGASSDFNGEYFVTDSTHTIGGGGYRTEFTARREGSVKRKKQS